jgi:hypothetical protein
VSGEPGEHSDWVLQEEQHTAADERIKVMVERHVANVVADEGHVAQACTAYPKTSRFQEMCISIHAHNHACRADYLGQQQRHVARPTPDIQNLHPAADARSLENMVRPCVEEPSLGLQPALFVF